MTSPLAPDDHIGDREAFSAFLARLRADYAANGQRWENVTLDRFKEDAQTTIPIGMNASHPVVRG